MRQLLGIEGEGKQTSMWHGLIFKNCRRGASQLDTEDSWAGWDSCKHYRAAQKRYAKLRNSFVI